MANYIIDDINIDVINITIDGSPATCLAIKLNQIFSINDTFYFTINDIIPLVQSYFLNNSVNNLLFTKTLNTIAPNASPGEYNISFVNRNLSMTVTYEQGTSRARIAVSDISISGIIHTFSNGPNSDAGMGYNANECQIAIVFLDKSGNLLKIDPLRAGSLITLWGLSTPSGNSNYPVLYSVSTNIMRSGSTNSITYTITDIYEYDELPSISDASVVVSPLYNIYTGSEITPEVRVGYKGNVLTENTDYTKSYVNNIDANDPYTAAVVTGINNYTGTKSITFYIVNAEDDDIFCYLLQYTWAYTGYPIKPGVEIIDRTLNYTLIEGTDYTVQYWNNVDATTEQDPAYVNITGIGDYNGLSRQLTFQILSNVEIPDPYDGDEDSENVGGDGEEDYESDDIDFPDLPTLSAADSGFVSLYIPTASQLSDAGEYVWSQDFSSVFYNFFDHPADCIYGLSIIPVTPSYYNSYFTLGNIQTGVAMRKVTSQFVDFDCGSVTIPEQLGSYLDYSPMTKVHIYLPFIGTQELDTDEVMGATLRLHYRIDVGSGACVAIIRVNKSDDINSRNDVLYSFTGNCACQIPISGASFDNVVASSLNILTSLGRMAITNGVSSSFDVANIASSIASMMKPTYNHTGNISGAGGFIGNREAYVIVNCPRKWIPTNQFKYTGYPGFMYSALSALSGFTKVEAIHLDGIPATQEELIELDSILKEGVIL